MSNVRELFPEGPPYDGYVCECGSTWFTLDALLGTDLRVTGWAPHAECEQCGTRVDIRGWVPGDES